MSRTELTDLTIIIITQKVNVPFDIRNMPHIIYST